jgi:hypothetical protein
MILFVKMDQKVGRKVLGNPLEYSFDLGRVYFDATDGKDFTGVP